MEKSDPTPPTGPACTDFLVPGMHRLIIHHTATHLSEAEMLPVPPGYEAKVQSPAIFCNDWWHINAVIRKKTLETQSQ